MKKQMIWSSMDMLDDEAREQYQELQREVQEVKQLFLVYDSAKEEALEYHYSPFLCKEDTA